MSKAKRQARKQAKAQKKATQKAKQGGKTKVGLLLKKAKDTLKKVGSNLRFAPLLPFVPMMTGVLNRRGIRHGKSIEDIVEKFYNNVAKHSKNFDGSDFDGGGVDANFQSYNIIPPAVIETVVRTVIEFIKQLKKKKDEGKALTQEEETALAQAESVTDAIDDLQEDETITQLKEFFFSWKGAVALVVVGGILYLVFKK